ncbi:MAG: UDP-2,3-diacylglucosamine diphosphatase [Gemmatimonadaceae bacterium]
MLNTTCHIVSDLHLGVATPVTERLFESYLASIAGKVRTLVINGDLFDFWFEWKTVIPRRGFRTLAALAALRDSGTEVLYIAGNHDCWGGEVLREDVGADYITGPWEGEIGPWRVRVEHGDGLRETEDRKYRMVRPIMRSPLAIRLFRSLHPDWATRLASGSSSASRTYAARDGGAGLRAIAHARLAAQPELNVVVLGHSHVAALERVGADQVFANAGSWLDAPTYLEITDEAISLLRWTGSAERDSLYVINR